MKKTPLRDVIRAAGFSPIERVYNSESCSKSAARMMNSRTPYYNASTQRYFHSSVSRLGTFDGVALVCLERASRDDAGTSKGYRVTVHDLDGHTIDRGEYGITRRAVDDLIASKSAADREFTQVCAAVESHTRDILAAAINRAAGRAARALEDLKCAKKLVRGKVGA